MRLWLVRGLLVTVGFLVPGLYLLRLALFDPSVAFLSPSLHAEWIVDPDITVFGRNPGEPAQALFCRDWHPTDRQEPTGLRFRCFGDGVVLANDQELLSFNGGNGKTPGFLDAAFLRDMPEVEICFRVSKTGSRPALLVESPAELRSGPEWEVRSGPDFGSSRQAVSASRAAVQPPDGVGLQTGPSLFRFWSDRTSALLWLGLVCLALAGWYLGRGRLVDDLQKALSRRRTGLLILLILSIQAVCVFRNTLNYPWDRSQFDARQHVEYLQWVSEQGGVPGPDKGFMMFQPPLYYLVSGYLYRVASVGGVEFALKLVQLLGSLVGASLSLVVYLSLRVLKPDRFVDLLLATAFTAFLPMMLYLNPIITNEVFAAGVFGWSFYALVRLWNRPTLKAAAMAGLLCGLSLLSKYTGLFVLLGGLALLGLRAGQERNRQAWKQLGVFFGVALLCSGWLYGRNWLLFGDPFVGSWDLFPFKQDPGFRTADFYLTMGNAFVVHPELTPWAGWWDGLYASTWGDVFRNLLAGSQREYFWMGLVFWLALSPTVAILIGWFGHARQALVRLKALDAMVVLIPLWMVQALTAYSLELPFASVVKAFYLLPLVPVVAILLVRGRQSLSGPLSPFRFWNDFSIVAIALISLCLYSY